MLLALALLASACCAPPRRCVEPTGAEEVWTVAGVPPILEGDHLESLEALVRRQREQGGPIRVLALSGGGQKGAFGAGFLAGWSRRLEREGPSWAPALGHHVVTGVSTGALMATFAFLGSPRDLELLRRFYTGVSEEDIMERRGLFELPCADSLYSAEPLARLIAETIDADVLRRVAAESRRGRRLFVATVDLDAGSLHVWDLTHLAFEQGEKGVERYRRVLLAAAMIPVLLPPVEIDGHLHADASVREMIFLRSFLGALDARLRQVEGVQALEPERVRIDVVVNDKMGVPFECTQPRVTDIGRRALGILLDELLAASLRRIRSDARRLGWEFQYVRIPPSFRENPGATEFDPDVMSALYELGLELGLRGGAWERDLPGDVEGLDS